jgi:hypothetical protein
MKASLVTIATRDAPGEILAPIVNRNGGSDDAHPFGLDPMFTETRAQKLAAGWYRRERKAVNEVEKILRAADLSTDAVTSVALRRSLDDVERIERMIISAEARRNAALREVARHRAAFAEDLRRNSQTVRDAEFTDMGRM